MDGGLETDIPVVPPAAVLAEVDAAWERALALERAGLELHLGNGRVGGRLRGELRHRGVVLARMTARQWLAFACGDTVSS